MNYYELIPVTTTFDGTQYFAYCKNNVIEACKRVENCQGMKEACLRKGFLDCDKCYMELIYMRCEHELVPIKKKVKQ